MAVLVVAMGFSLAFVVAAFQPLLEAEYGFDSRALSIGVAVFYCAASLFSIPAGRMTERFGAAETTALSFAVMALSYLWLMVVTGRVEILCLMALGGVSNALCIPASNSLIAGTPGQTGIGLRFGVRQAAVPGGALLAGLGATAGGLGMDWRTVGAVLAGLCGLCSWVSMSGRAGGDGGRLSARCDVPSMHSGRPRTMSIVLAAWVGGVSGTIIPVFYVSALITWGLSLQLAGLSLTVASLAGVAARIWWGWLADLTGWCASTTLGNLMVLGGFAVVLFPMGSGHYWFFLVGPVVFVLAMGHGGIFNLMVVNAAQGHAARFSGVVQVFVHAGGVTGPLLYGLLLSLGLSHTSGWLLVGILSVAAGLPLIIAQLHRGDD